MPSLAGLFFWMNSKTENIKKIIVSKPLKLDCGKTLNNFRQSATLVSSSSCVALPLMQLAMLLRQDTITAHSVLVVHRSVTPCQ